MLSGLHVAAAFRQAHPIAMITSHEKLSPPVGFNAPAAFPSGTIVVSNLVVVAHERSLSISLYSFCR